MADDLSNNTNNTGGGSLVDLITSSQNGVKYLGLIVQAIKTVFPQQTGTATSASAGAATLPANPAGFMVVTLPNGTSVKVPYYN